MEGTIFESSHSLENHIQRQHKAYLRTIPREDLDFAIQNCQELLRTEYYRWRTANRIYPLQELAILYSVRYQQTRNSDVLELCIQRCQQAIDLTPEDHPDLADRLEILAVAYGNRYQLNKTLEDLELAIQYGEKTIDLVPGDHPDRANRLQNLAAGYCYRYLRTGELDDLALFIERSQEVVNFTSGDHPERVNRLQNLAAGYRYRYLWTGALDDLECYVQRSQEVVDLTPKNHPDRANRHWYLRVAHRYRYLRTGARDDLKIYVHQTEEASKYSLENHPDRALDDIEFCILRWQEADDLLFEDHPKRAPDDLELCIQRSQTAVDILLERHPDRADKLHNLAIRYWYRYVQTRVKDDVNHCIQLLGDASSHEYSPPMVRLRAGRKLTTLMARGGMWQEAYKIAAYTTMNISLLVPRSLKYSDMQYWVNKFAGLASDTSAIALKAGEPVSVAIDWLLGYCDNIANSMIDRRVDTTDLNEKFPHLAEQFNKLQDQLDTPKDLRKDSRRHNIAERLKFLIADIEHLPVHGFDRCFFKLSEDDFRKATAYASIVVANVSKYGCYALIIEQREQKALNRIVLELPSLDIKDIQIKANELASLNTEILRWLWETIACPVLDAMNFVQTPKDIWPRIQWVLTGPLGRFPIHAAGCYSEGEIQTTVMDRVISSYGSSLGALIKAYSRVNPSVSLNVYKPASMVLVDMKDTPGYSSLPFASKEIEVLASFGDSMQLQVERPKSCQKDVLSAIKDCKIFHFAGHGYSDPLDPSKSALVLSDGRLTVKDIFDINLLHQPFLAYLSACGTGQVKQDGLIDEGLHLIGAYQQAGFQHVIGTLWNVIDESCVDIAKMTYQWIQKNGQSHNSVSEGLQHSCMALRSRWAQENEVRAVAQLERSMEATSIQERSVSTEKKDPREIESIEELPLYWVPYIHCGI